jgi:uncharacterized 2Fe-2S/4Fe-4S cluster protein (DUF4445 family)
MVEHLIRFDTASQAISVPTGTLLSEAARMAGVEIGQPCGGQGRCGRCAVQVKEGAVRRRSTMRLSSADVEQGYALACQSVVEGDAFIVVPPQERIERQLTTDRTAADIYPPAGYVWQNDQSIRRFCIRLNPPSMEDQTDDWSRLQTALRQEAGLERVDISIYWLRRLGQILRQGEWVVTVVVDVPDAGTPERARLVDLQPGEIPDEAPIWGAAIDIGTTTVTVLLVDLISGRIEAQVSEYNGQIARGEDVISRIVYASKSVENQAEMQRIVLGTIDELLTLACKRVLRAKQPVSPADVVKATIAGNSTMMHLFLEIPAVSIRLSPFVTAANQIPVFAAADIGLGIHPQGSVVCLPGVASYVGADITAGVLSAGVDQSEEVNLFIDVGTNGETVLGTKDWLVTCACSAGPAFEGAGVGDGMRATKGAIEEVWINSQTFEPTYRVIGKVKPRGFCGSGLISLLAELFMTGVVDKAGNLNTQLESARIREGENGMEYVVAWGAETEQGRDLAITRADIDNLLRAKAAIYAGFTVLADSVGFPLDEVHQLLIGGSFGKYINVEKAVQIGLLPDMPWERFQFLGNTSVRGAYAALLDYKQRDRIQSIASRMTYIELSADNSFYEAFMSAMFLPHTELNRFPSIQAVLSAEKIF